SHLVIATRHCAVEGIRQKMLSAKQKQEHKSEGKNYSSRNVPQLLLTAVKSRQPTNRFSSGVTNNQIVLTLYNPGPASAAGHTIGEKLGNKIRFLKNQNIENCSNSMRWDSRGCYNTSDLRKPVADINLSLFEITVRDLNQNAKKKKIQWTMQNAAEFAATASPANFMGTKIESINPKKNFKYCC
ncbi:hypothetical protein L9F63_008392, partial [Diploptera punctata]